MIAFLNLQDLLFSVSAPETRAASHRRKNRHPSAIRRGVAGNGAPFRRCLTGAEPQGESRCVGKTARFGGFRRAANMAAHTFLKIWKSAFIFSRDGIRWEVPE